MLARTGDSTSNTKTRLKNLTISKGDEEKIANLAGTYESCFGGLEVACRPLVPKFAGKNPTEKILSTSSFGGEVKPSVPCLRFTACKRSLNVTWKIHRPFLAHVVPPLAARFSRRRLVAKKRRFINISTSGR